LPDYLNNKFKTAKCKDYLKPFVLYFKKILFEFTMLELVKYYNSNKLCLIRTIMYFDNASICKQNPLGK
jgi:hypothetical protein